ncbi:PDZ domain-containing protein [Halomicronema sp. CCY15110]|uniref:PDZ domain-containing protein n=1 Tax=Halomicronema sp. CCY15110 TaxID=2767773 RepID=UPI00195278E6|nr:PDZ domain-containing protein [Halomicronema sp. CCY15110]
MNDPRPPESDQDLNIRDSSVEDAQVGQAQGNLTQIKDSVIHFVQKPVSIAVSALVAIVGSIGIIVAGRQNNVINIEGGVGEGATVANQLQIFQGDSPEEKQRKIDQAKALIAEEVFTNIANLDARLNLLPVALTEDNRDDFDARLGAVREQVAPALSQTFEGSYQQLIQKQAIASLRSAFASYPLYEVREPLIQVLLDGNVDASRVEAFYNRLTEVRDASESLLQELSEAAEVKQSDHPDLVAHHEKRVKLAIRKLENRSQLAHLSALMLLDSLESPLPDAQAKLSTLKVLTPSELIPQREMAPLMAAAVSEAEQLVAQRAALLEEAKKLRDAALDDYAQVNESLVIRASDPWSTVVAKAISLRQLGRTSEAIAAFSRYSDMFADTDLTARQYARTAQQLTLQLDQLAIAGGVYLYEIVPNGAADQIGLQTGDIIVRYGDRPITTMPDLVNALQATTPREPISLTWLRMAETGTFQRQTHQIPGGPLGAGMMPI